MPKDKSGKANNPDETPLTEDDFIEALKKASRPVEDQEPVEEIENEDD